MLSPETVTREDLIVFLNAAFACTGQREFYATADEQRVSVQFLHSYILGNYRSLYARTLAAGVNDFNCAEIIVNLLSSGQQTPPEFRQEENALVTAALSALPPQRAWKIVTRLRQERVNNRRMRAIVREFTLRQRDLNFQAVKYRRHLRGAAIHAHIPLPGELPEFLLGEHKKAFQTPLFETFRRAGHSHEALYELPYTVAQGLAARHGIAPEVFLRRIEPHLSEGERLRLQGQANRSGGEVKLNPERLPLTALCSYVLSLPVAERLERRAELSGWLDAAAAQVLRRGLLPLPAGRIAVVLDNSYSASGSGQKRRRPLALALASEWLLRTATSVGLFKAFWTQPSSETQPSSQALAVTASGQTNLTDRLLDALEWGAAGPEPLTVIVVSDGVENDPPNAFHAALVAAQRIMTQLNVLHFNPVFDAEMLTVRGLSPLVPAVGLRNADDLAVALGFARFCAGQSELTDLEGYLSERVQAMLTNKVSSGSKPGSSRATGSAPEVHHAST
jgi:hypothetical protein